ncbi:DUF4261 domain-containing protein [Aeoliella mucimassa]|uniref:DUF4261 domain-containing protein n=1 Tax=Aeoliella mucimassa TaxID=2527972 RepID=A0A518AMN3_9BACT|nr:DUF4261 domain-containing protein [Aeoliella mucimassa]QDU55966.1 hypothetical protein Pan181_21680 [Aeoliella mucimassa]
MSIQTTELLYRQPPELDFRAIRERAEQLTGSTVELPESDASQAVIFLHPEHLQEYADNKMAAPQTAILRADKVTDPAKYVDELQQSWLCREANELIAGTNHGLLVSEMLSRTLTPPVRARLFHGVLQAVIEHSDPAAVVCKNSQQIIPPRLYLDGSEVSLIERPSVLNVRFYNVSNSPGTMLMDTRGMQEIGLVDLQCHFRDLDPQQVASKLFSTALYLFKDGNTIEAGDTLEGIEPGTKWTCRYEDSLWAPERPVLDLNPGDPFAAGNRS